MNRDIQNYCGVHHGLKETMKFELSVEEFELLIFALGMAPGVAVQSGDHKLIGDC